MQHTQQREQVERISWARAMIFAVGFFFISALLIGQVTTYIFNQMTAASLAGFEQGTLALGLTCLVGFVIIHVVMLLFDPTSRVSPLILSGLGALLAIGCLSIRLSTAVTGNQ